MKHFFPRLLQVFVYCFILLAPYSCRRGEKPAEGLLSFNIEELRDTPEEIRMSEFIAGVTYIPLETTDESLINRTRQVYLTRDFIMVVESAACLLFDRNTGAFIREVGRQGRGPGEYSRFSFLDDGREEVWFSDYRGNLVRYNLMGDYIGSVTIPGSMPSEHKLSIARLDDEHLVCYYLNLFGDEERLAVVFDEKGNSIRIFKNRQFVNQRKHLSFARDMGVLQRIDNKLVLNVFHNDTVFEVTTDTLVPRFIFSRGQYRPPFDFYLRETEEWFELTEQKRLIVHFNFMETDRFILFEYYPPSSIALYDKVTGSLKAGEKSSGLVNDLGLPLLLYQGSVSADGELPLLQPAGDILKWIEENQDMMKGNSPEIEAIRNIKPEDNPVVSIVAFRNR